MRRESRLLQGIGHTLEPPGSLVELQRPPRAIADRKDPRIARSCLLIDDDPVITVQTAGRTQFLVGNGAHTYQHQVRLLSDAPIKGDFARRWRAAHQQLSDRLVETKAHSSIGMVALKKDGDGLARDP